MIGRASPPGPIHRRTRRPQAEFSSQVEPVLETENVFDAPGPGEPRSARCQAGAPARKISMRGAAEHAEGSRRKVAAATLGDQTGTIENLFGQQTPPP